MKLGPNFMKILKTELLSRIKIHKFRNFCTKGGRKKKKKEENRDEL